MGYSTSERGNSLEDRSRFDQRDIYIRQLDRILNRYPLALAHLSQFKVKIIKNTERVETKMYDIEDEYEYDDEIQNTTSIKEIVVCFVGTLT